MQEEIINLLEAEMIGALLHFFPSHYTHKWVTQFGFSVEYLIF